ncbi:hypothetical protein [Sporichthya polymorpha]|uniref:hypothetical protein n=1 Tax=Sporichthya polymorpha TaxID=35751 RepID=UPI00036A0D3A|nr:hypothetical protein [Sporichthya polymorpha]
MRRTLARLGLVLLFVGAAVPTLGAGTAHACSCAMRTEAESFRDAEAVFTGTLVSRDLPNAGNRMQSSIDPAIHTFAVDRVYKGSITDPQRVVSYSGGASCGLELRGPGPFVVFAGRGGDAPESLSAYADLPRASLCGGSRALAANETLPFGRGRAPAAASPAPASPSLASTDTPSILGPSSDAEEDDGPGTSTAVALGIAAVALIAGGIVLRTRGRR